jgi:hypothetical protein
LRKSILPVRNPVDMLVGGLVINLLHTDPSDAKPKPNRWRKKAATFR